MCDYLLSLWMVFVTQRIDVDLQQLYCHLQLESYDLLIQQMHYHFVLQVCYYLCSYYS